MIVVALNGGLGNQLFQYAIARRLAHDRGVQVRFDLNMFSNPSQNRVFQLGHFEVRASTIAGDELKEFWGWRNIRLLRKWLEITELCKPYYKRTVVQEREVGFDRNILSVGSHVYLQGYWQSEKYFKTIADQVRKELRPRDPWSGQNDIIKDQVRACQAVSVHVRRGDYLDNPDINKTHGVLTAPYYEQAIQILKNKVTAPNYFVFSDDVNWARENLDFHAPTFYISHNNGTEDYWDMILMSYCSHHIIANSSFSWWGAWLDPNDEKTVIAPKRWYKADIINPDLLPKEWIKL